MAKVFYSSFFAGVKKIPTARSKSSKSQKEHLQEASKSNADQNPSKFLASTIVVFREKL